MFSRALYYPTIDIKNEAWLKSAVLYWDRIETIVPESIQQPYQRRTTRALEDSGILFPHWVNPNSEEVRGLELDVATYLNTKAVEKQSLKDYKRNSNLELYRIITMLAIVAHHYVVNSGLIGGAISCDDFNTRNVFFLLFGMWGKTGINCFVLITGYFMCTSQITLRKFLKLMLQIEFYAFVISLPFWFYHYEGFSMKDLVLLLIPVTMVSDWFTSCFILFWLTIPFLNVLIRNMDRKMHLRLIALCLFIYTAVLYIPTGGVRMNYVSWFMVLYFISSYIRLYPEYIYRSNSTKTWGWLSFAAVLLAVGSVVFLLWRNDVYERTKQVYFFVSDSNAILALLVGVTTFMFFKNLRIPHNKFINAVGGTTFGILLIHAHSDVMRHWLWRDTVDCVGHYSDAYYYLYAPVAVLCIFAVCSCIDYIRINTLETWVFHYLDSKCQNKV